MRAATKDNIGENCSLAGKQLRPERPFRLVENIYNAGVSRQDIGSKKWLKLILKLLRKQRYPDLIRIIGTNERPINPPYVKRILNGSSRPYIRGQSNIRFLGQQLPKRLEEASLRFRECLPRDLSFLTVVTSAQFTIEDTLRELNDNGASLERFIRRRFPDSKWAIIPEVSIHRLSEMNDGLFPDARWRLDKDPDHIVYKVHFHGIICCPKLTPDQVQEAFKTTPTGKRSAYCGEHQVRALPVEMDEMSPGNKPDVLGCFGYATKGHFKMPNTKRMIEGAAEWLVIQDHIYNNQSLIRIGGMRGGIKVSSEPCDEIIPQSKDYPNRSGEVDEWDREIHCEKYNLDVRTSEQVTSTYFGSHNTKIVKIVNLLNWLRPTYWKTVTNSALEKRHLSRSELLRQSLGSLWAKLGP